jgi:hemolysin III
VFALYLAVPAFAVLFAVASSTRARLAVAIYAVGFCAMLVSSSVYHRWVHTLRARAVWRRVDHAMIFAAIAGTATPLCLLGVSRPLGVWLLVVMWVSSLFGIVMKIAGWRHQRIAGGIMYIGVGWVGTIALPSVYDHLGWKPVLLVLLGGVFYTLGAIGLYRKWPKLRPHVFGYHEVWHACTVLAAIAHLSAVWLIAA